jgi:ADP-ribose pyrophosphatase YjhB (NUDIX family)
LPSFGVATAVLDDAGRVLLAKREDLETWTLPGGAVDDGESLAQAAVREVAEETGVAVRLTRLVGLYSRPTWSRHIAVFAAVPTGGQLAAQPGEVVDLGYFPADALPDPLLWWFRQPIADALAGATAAVWTQDAIWPFPFGPQEYSAMRAELARSGLSKADFYRRHLTQIGPAGEQRELGTA